MKVFVFIMMIIVIFFCSCDNFSGNQNSMGLESKSDISMNNSTNQDSAKINVKYNKYISTEPISNNTRLGCFDIQKFEMLFAPEKYRPSRSWLPDLDLILPDSGDLILRENGGVYYSVAKYKDINSEGYCFILYDCNVYPNEITLTLKDVWLVNKIPQKSDFNFTVGKSILEDVKEVDSVVLFKKSEENTVQESYHRFADGTMAIIQYELNNEEKMIISYIGIEKDPTNFVDILLPIDLALIQ